MQYLDFSGILEQHIRPTSHHILSLAFTLKLNIYSEEIAKVSEDDAMAILKRLINSAAYRHKSNNKIDATGWGDHWQSAYWAADIAHGAWFVWEQLSDETKDLVANMIVYEANRFNNKPAPYYMDKEGKILYKGDTKAEGNAWNSQILTCAVLMLPQHENVEIWKKRNFEYQISAYSCPNDLKNNKIVDGYNISEILNGSNAYNNGTVVNHNILHPDYMTAIKLNITNTFYYELAQKPSLGASTHNFDIVYNALSKEKYNGKTMYQKDENGKASHNIYFPQGNDWCGERQANYWLVDLFAMLYNLGEVGEIMPVEWAEQRSKEMIRMMERDTTGPYYQSKKEDNFMCRDEWINKHLTYGYMAMWLHGENFRNWEVIKANGTPTGRHESDFVEHKGKFYLLGGRGINNVDIFDPATNTWTKAGKTPFEIHHFQAISYKDAIYILGAMTGKYPVEKPVENIWIYYPKKDVWEKGDEIPEDLRRGGAGSILYQDKIYQACGITYGHTSGTTNVFNSYNLKTGEWERLTATPHIRDHIFATIANDKLYVIGGRNTSVHL